MKKPLFSVASATSAIALSTAFATLSVSQTHAAEFNMEVGGYFESQAAYGHSENSASDDRLQTVDFGVVDPAAVTSGAGAAFDRTVTYTYPGKDLSDVDYIGVDSKRDSEIHFKPSVTLDNGVRIGATVELESATSGDQIDEAYISVDGSFGRIVLGSENSARYLMHYAAPDATFFGANSGDVSNYIPMSGRVGIFDDGTFDEEDMFIVGNMTDSTRLYTEVLTRSGPMDPEYISREISTRFPNLDPMGAVYGHDFFRATLGSTYIENDANNDAERITWFSPRMSGFQFGASYARDMGQDENAQADVIDERLSNIMDFGINYVGNIGTVDLAVSGGYGVAFGDLETSGDEHPRVWNAGLNLSWKGWTIGGSFAEQNNSSCTLPDIYKDGADVQTGVGRTNVQFGMDGRDHRTECDANNLAHRDGISYDAGVSYETGPWGFSFTYFRGENVDNEYNPDAQVLRVGHDQGTTDFNNPPPGHTSEFGDDIIREIDVLGDGEHRGYNGLDETHTMFLVGVNYDLAKGVRLNAFGAYALFEEDTGDDGGKGEETDGFVVGTGMRITF